MHKLATTSFALALLACCTRLYPLLWWHQRRRKALGKLRLIWMIGQNLVHFLLCLCIVVLAIRQVSDLLRSGFMILATSIATLTDVSASPNSRSNVDPIVVRDNCECHRQFRTVPNTYAYDTCNLSRFGVLTGRFGLRHQIQASRRLHKECTKLTAPKY